MGWVDYAREAAQKLEGERRWLAAQAYWYASAQLLIQGKQHSSEAFSESLKGILRTGICSAGTLVTSQGLEELAEEGLSSTFPDPSNALVENKERVLSLCCSTPYRTLHYTPSSGFFGGISRQWERTTSQSIWASTEGHFTSMKGTARYAMLICRVWLLRVSA